MANEVETFETPSAFLASLGGRRKRVLALGEPTHGIEDFLLVRNEFFKDLVEREGYTAIAIESDCLAGMVVDEFISGGPGSLDEVLETGFSHDFGRLQGNRELVEWLRGCEKPLRFFGFDAPTETMWASSPKTSLVALHGFLAARLEEVPYSLETIEALLGEDQRWTNPEAAMDPSKSVGASPDAVRLRQIADALQSLLESELALLGQGEPEELWQARLHARSATGLLRYHAAMAEASPDRIAGLMRLRTAMMAENLLAITENHRTLVFAHNLHLRRDQSSLDIAGQDIAMQTVVWRSAGAIAAAKLGDEYAFIASALGSASQHGLETPEPDTLEGILSTLVGRRSIVRSAHLAGVLPAAPKVRTTANRAYFPLDPDLVRDSDGIVYLNDTLSGVASA